MYVSSLNLLAQLSPVPVVLGSVFLNFFQLLLFLASLFLILLVLVQRGKGGGLTGALGGMGGQSAFGSKAGDAFTKITIITTLVWLTLCMVTISRFNPPPPAQITKEKTLMEKARLLDSSIGAPMTTPVDLGDLPGDESGAGAAVEDQANATESESTDSAIKESVTTDDNIAQRQTPENTPGSAIKETVDATSETDTPAIGEATTEVKDGAVEAVEEVIDEAGTPN